MTPLRLLLATPVVLAATLLAALAWPTAAPPPAPIPVPPPPPLTTAHDPAVEVLHEWDERRAAAWATGDPTALRRLYVAGSRSGRADVALLTEYVARDIAVRGLRMQLLAVSVTHRSSDRLVLVVTDRVAAVRARHAGRLLHLPRDRPTTHRVSLVAAPDGWRVEEVRAAQPAR